MIVFASSLTVENFVKMTSPNPLLIKEGAPGEVPVACIGPVTAKTAKALGLNVAVVPKKSTMPDLVEAVVAYFRGVSRS